jgi:Transposase IS116/IS110/IS902 family
VLAQALAMFDSLAQRILECDSKIEALLVPLGRHEAELAGPGKRLGKNAPQFDARAALARWAGVDLTRINGLSVTTVMTILSEIGPDLSRFASIKHFCSWLGLCPGTKISGGKVLSARTRRSANRVRQALKLAAMSLPRNDSALGAFYRRLCARMDKPRANTAVAHKLARMVYFMLRSAALRGTAAPAQHRGAQTPRVRAWFPDHSRHENGLKTTRTSMRCFSRELPLTSRRIEGPNASKLVLVSSRMIARY